MGYYTRYALQSALLNDDRAPLQAVLGEPEPDFEKIIGQGPDGYCPFHEPCKWYDHDKDMLKLSKEFPAYVFTLT